MFAEYAEVPFTAEAVEVRMPRGGGRAGVESRCVRDRSTNLLPYLPRSRLNMQVVYEEAYRAAGTGYTTPQLATRAAAASVATLSGIAGTSISAEDAVRLARRMQLTGRVTNDGASFEVDVPPTRPDILQECDIIGERIPILRKCCSVHRATTSICDLFCRNFHHSIVCRGCCHCVWVQ